MSSTIRRSSRVKNNNAGVDAPAIDKVPPQDRYMRMMIKKQIPDVTVNSRNAICLEFATSEEEWASKFPKYLFCCKCRAFVEDFTLDQNNSKRKVSSVRYKCEAGHLNHAHPTTLIKLHYTLRGQKEADGSDDDDKSKHR